MSEYVFRTNEPIECCAKCPMLHKQGSAWCQYLLKWVPTNEETERRKDCPLKELPPQENPWHTGTPTELGDYVVAFKCIHECKQKGMIEYHTWHISEEEFGYKVIKGQPSDDVWKAVAYQKIEPYEDTKEKNK